MSHVANRKCGRAAVGMVLTASGLDHWAASPLEAHVEDLGDAAASGSRRALVGVVTNLTRRGDGSRGGGGGGGGRRRVRWGGWVGG